MTPLTSVAVVGAGTMGLQLATFLATAAHPVTLVLRPSGDPDATRASLTAQLDRRVSRGKLTAAESAAALKRITVTAGFVRDVDVDLVIETITEDVAQKRDLLADLSRNLPTRTIVASNSSSFVPSMLADATGRPDRFLNLHFFNPVSAMRCVEVIPGPQTSPAVVAAVSIFVRSLDRQTVNLQRETPGFVANRILYAARDEAIALAESGICSISDIDEACRGALGYPMGPFELMDLTGLDVGFRAKSARYAQTGDTRDRPAASVAALVSSGDLGRKTGRGCYVYVDGERMGENPAVAHLFGVPR